MSFVFIGFVMLSLIRVLVVMYFFFFKQKTAYEMRISDWSSDVCSSDLLISISALCRPGSGIIVVIRCSGIGSSGVRWPAQPWSRFLSSRSCGEAHPCTAGLGLHARAKSDARGCVPRLALSLEIGRASCRERVGQYV